MNIPNVFMQPLSEGYLAKQLIGHISRDSTAISVREKPVKKAVTPVVKKKRGRPEKGEERGKGLVRLERQSAGMSLAQMKADLPTLCRVGVFHRIH
ncbi:MAG TPA: hypothetical protein ENI62_07825 [Gammaproteobacteria bacterium]|nr:hypothetical protein [Gammaproteobacteria bacterium]